MFTGIIEAVGIVRDVQQTGNNLDLLISASIAHELKIDQSVAHNGICLTVVNVSDGYYKVTAVDETIEKTNLGLWEIGDRVNLERALKLGDRLDGHLVQGHVDQTAVLSDIIEKEGSTKLIFYFKEKDFVLVEKGSVCIDGISLTCFDVKEDTFAVEIIPYTLENTNLRKIKVGSVVNLEFDMMGKYLAKYLQRSQNKR